MRAGSDFRALLAQHVTPARMRRLRYAPARQEIVERRNHDAKSPLCVRPIFLRDDDRITGLISIAGLALRVFGLIQADLERAIHPKHHLPGLPPENRSATPTGANTLHAFEPHPTAQAPERTPRSAT